MGKRIKRIKEYHLIGRLVKRLHPALAQQIIDTYITPEPLCNDFSKIPELFSIFCKIKGLDPKNVRGVLFKTSNVDHRRLFASVTIRIFNPQIYNHPQDALFFRKGFNIYMARFLGISTTNMSKTIRDSVIQEKLYDNIREEVDRLVEEIRGQADWIKSV